MRHVAASPDRLRTFSDGVFAIIMTILVLELRPPDSPTFSAFLSLWSTGLSYAVSYLFLAIVWINHHHVMRYAEVATPRLIWGNFAHLFTVSLMPFSMAWIASPVSLYAAVFVLVNATYIALYWEVVDRPNIADVSPRTRRMMRIRSFVTLALFAAATVVALRFPIGGLGLICCCLILYLRPEAPMATAEHDQLLSPQMKTGTQA
jgi:uncharacterized membrane protein